MLYAGRRCLIAGGLRIGTSAGESFRTPPSCRKVWRAIYWVCATSTGMRTPAAIPNVCRGYSAELVNQGSGRRKTLGGHGVSHVGV